MALEWLDKGLEKNKVNKFLGGDMVIWSLVIVMMLFSIAIAFSANASMAYAKFDGDTTRFLIRRTLHVLVSFFALYWVYRMDFAFFRKYTAIIFFFTLVALIAVFFFGANINSAKRSIPVPIIGSIQPSDFAKVSVILMLASVLTRYKDVLDKVSFLPFRSYFGRDFRKREEALAMLGPSWRLLLPVILVFVLVMPSNLSTASIIAFVCIVLMLVAGVRLVEVVKLGVAAIIPLVIVIVTMYFAGMGRAVTWVNRIKGLFSETDSFQVQQAKIAIASGWLPRGPGNSTQRSNLPHPYSDYVYAFIIEEYGAIIAFLLALAYLCILYRAIRIARNNTDIFENLVCVGLALMIAIQAVLHMMVSLDIMPTTGITLPLISYGGSSLLAMSIAMGLILNISYRQKVRQSIRTRQTAAATEPEDETDGAVQPEQR